ncbi:hypothetical protein PTKIN_Ptkin05aG0140600 [Pterospermum kingtungense]
MGGASIHGLKKLKDVVATQSVSHVDLLAEVGEDLPRQAPLIFLVGTIETRLKSTKMEHVRFKLDFDSCLMVDSRGRGGGLALLWEVEAGVEILSYSIDHIDALIGKKGSDMEWRYTGFYGKPDSFQRHRTWNLLLDLNGRKSLPWLVYSDYNEILFDLDKLDGELHST